MDKNNLRVSFMYVEKKDQFSIENKKNQSKIEKLKSDVKKIKENHEKRKNTSFYQGGGI